MKSYIACEKERMRPKEYLLALKIDLLQELFKAEFNRVLCYDKTNDFFIDFFEPTVDDLRQFVQSINGKELKHSMLLQWKYSLEDICTGPSYLNSYAADWYPKKYVLGFGQSRFEVEAIVTRATVVYEERDAKLDPLSLQLDLCAAKHALPDICLQTLLKLNDDDFFHDISGIVKNLNRQTGRIEKFFMPKSYNLFISIED